MAEFPKIITVDNEIQLVKLEPTFENATRVFQIIERNREHLAPWFAWMEHVHKPEDEFVPIMMAYNNSRSEYFIKYNGEIAGACGFHHITSDGIRGEIEYWLGCEFTGRGIMLRVIKMFEKLGFNEWGFNRIEIHCDIDNTISARVPQRLEYNLDGIMRQDSLDANGNFHDMQIWSKLKSEWKED